MSKFKAGDQVKRISDINPDWLCTSGQPVTVQGLSNDGWLI